MDPTPATATTAPAETSEFPKPLVRLRPVVGGYEADVRLVADADAEGTATAEGWQAVAIPEGYAYQQYPRWLYHKDGRRQVVHTQEEAARPGGHAHEPPAPARGAAAERRPATQRRCRRHRLAEPSARPGRSRVARCAHGPHGAAG